MNQCLHHRPSCLKRLTFTINRLVPDKLLVAHFRTALAQSREYFAETDIFQDRDKRFDKQKER